MFSIPVYFLDILYVGMGRAAHEAVMYTRIRSLSCFKGHEVDFQINYIKDEFLFDYVFYTTSMDFVLFYTTSVDFVYILHSFPDLYQMTPSFSFM